MIDLAANLIGLCIGVIFIFGAAIWISEAIKLFREWKQ